MEFSSGRKRVIDELTRGRELIDHLRVMLNGDGALEQPVAVAEGLVENLLDTFDESLSILSSTESDEVSRFPAVNWDGRKSGDSSKSCNTFESKDRRGRYKRRRTSETWIKDSPTQFEDGHAWRKYGQKVILNAKYPRSYLRCTHKYDQGCQASKQVQQIEDDPPKYRTTYIGHHICNKPSEIMTVKDSSIIMNFGSGSGSTSPKPIADYIVPHHALANFSSGGDRGDVISSDVYSCTASTHSISMDTDMMVDSLFDVLPEF